MAYSPPRSRHRPPSSLERVSLLLERLDRRPGAHARHLARTRRLSAAKWAAAAVTISGIAALLAVTAMSASPVLELAAAALAGLAVADRRPDRLPAWLHARCGPRTWQGVVALDSAVAVAATGLRPAAIVLLGVAAGLGAAAAVIWRWRVRSELAGARKARVGADVELSVARTLDSMGVRVRHSVMLGAGGDADHVIVSETGQVAVVETKTGGGQVSVDEDGRIRKGSGLITGDPIEQVLRQAAALSRRASAPVDAIVCVASMRNRPFGAHGVVVCSERDLPGVVRSLPSRLPPAAAERLYRQLV